MRLDPLLDRLSSPIAIFVVVLLVAFVALRFFIPQWLERTPKVAHKPLLTRAEHRFLRILTEALPGYMICPQVAMGALLKVADDVDKRQVLATRNKFSQKIVDFAIVDPADGSVVALVELDDSSHDTARDRRRDAMLYRAGYRVERFSNRPFPDVPFVRDRMMSAPVEVLS